MKLLINFALAFVYAFGVGMICLAILGLMTGPDWFAVGIGLFSSALCYFLGGLIMKKRQALYRADMMER